MFVGIDHNLQICVAINIRPCDCAAAYVHKRIVAHALSHFRALTGVLSDVCCLPHFRAKRTSRFWTSGECYEFIMRARRVLLLYPSSRACHSSVLNYSSFFKILFSWKTLITESGISLPAWQHTVTTSFTYFKGSPACFLLPLSVYCMHAYCSFPSKNSSASHFCPTIISFTTNPSSEPLSVYLSTVSVWGRQHLHPRVNSFKRACE